MNTSLTHWIPQKHFKSTVIQESVASNLSTSHTSSKSSFPFLKRSTLLPLLSRGSSTCNVAQQLSNTFCTLKKTEKQLSCFSFTFLVQLLQTSLRSLLLFYVLNIALNGSPSSVKSMNTRVLARCRAGLTRLPSGVKKQSVPQSSQSRSSRMSCIRLIARTTSQIQLSW